MACRPRFDHFHRTLRGGRLDEADRQRGNRQSEPHGVVDEDVEQPSKDVRLMGDDQIARDQVEQAGDMDAGPATAAE